MARKATQLPSGSWRIQISTGKTWNAEKGKWDYHIKSLTAPTEPELRYLEAQWDMTHKFKDNAANPTLREAIHAYIEKNRGIIADSTIYSYEKILKYAFPDLMNIRILSLDDSMINASLKNEYGRKVANKNKTVSPKTVKNEWGLISSVLSEYHIHFNVKLKSHTAPVHDISMPDVLFKAFKGTDIELPVLLAMWLSFSMSEIRGLTKSGSIKGDRIYIDRVIVTTGNTEITKDIAKNGKRNRALFLPPYIKSLIDKVDGDILVPLSAKQINARFKKRLAECDLPYMTFHDLRHVAASTMEMLGVPDKYKMERGGWSTPHIMQSTYIQTFNTTRRAFDEVIDGYFESIIDSV